MHVVTLITDFGTQDYYAAELKGCLLSASPGISIVDVSHSIESYDIVQASFFLSSVYSKFPPGTIHIISVFNYYDEDVEHIAIEREGYYFIAPNNGVLSLLFEDIKEEETHKIDFKNGHIASRMGHAVGLITHGLPLSEMGPHPAEVTRKMGIQPVITSSQIRATIIHIDHYENVVVNLTKELFEKIGNGRPFSLYYKQTEPITKISKNYGDAPVGETLCLFNSAEYLEIAVNMGKASSMFNLNKDETIQINFH
ncbi:MAG: SAM-dependent chlorinase/fluorinase [Saprospiraceae bacterium]|nr:SAM-dependent chlorinase/fluorinase [Saprospiraceae bacterium]